MEARSPSGKYLNPHYPPVAFVHRKCNREIMRRPDMKSERLQRLNEARKIVLRCV